MTYRGPWGVYIHIPKCGGFAVRSRLAEIEAGEVISDHWHATPRIIKTSTSTPLITYVRHPVLWYRSLWSYRKSLGWGTHTNDQMWHEIIQKTKHADALPWPDWVAVIARTTPGLYGWLLDKYAHPRMEWRRLEGSGVTQRKHVTDNKPAIRNKEAVTIEATERAVLYMFNYKRMQVAP